MDSYTLENFINFCDDMVISEENFKDVFDKIADFVEMFIKKATDLIQRMIFSFKKFKSYKVPDEIRKNIVRVRSSCDKLWFDLISRGESNYDNKNNVDVILRSAAYTELFIEKRSYDESTFLDVPVNAVISDLQRLHKTLTNTQIVYNKSKRHNQVISHEYWNNIISCLQISIKALNQYFVYGKASSNTNEIIDMPDFEVEIIDS